MDAADEALQHKSMAVAANNAAWQLIGAAAKADGVVLSPDQAFALLGQAYASAYHWQAFAGADSINAARAAWLCSRAHAACGDGGAALRSAELCRGLTAACGDDAADFDHFYAAEARARALASLGRVDEAAEAKAQVEALLADIADPEDHRLCAGDLASGPWFGL